LHFKIYYAKFYLIYSSSREWNSVSEEQKEEIGLVREADGEFWMCFSDFLANWHTVQICHLSADSFSGSITEGNQVFNHFKY
jgi:hypothetical protein